MKFFVSTKHTLEEYNKKYRNCSSSLVKVTKKELNDFDIKNSTKIKGYLLKNRKWWLIGDTYYEIPKAPRWAWFRNLNAAAQITTCVLLGIALASAVAVPTVLILKSIVHVDVEGTSKSIVEIKEKKYVGENFEITLSLKDEDKKFTDEITVKIGDVTLKPKDYTFDKTTGKLSIKKSIVEANEGKHIIVNPTIKDKIYVTSVECEETITIKVGHEISFDDLHIKINPGDADDKTYKISESTKLNNEFFEIDQTNKKIKGLKAGNGSIDISANGVNPKSPCKSAVCKITVENVYATEITSDSKKVMVIGDEISFDDLNVKIMPEDTTIKTFTVTDISENNDSYISIDQTNRKIKSIKEGTAKIKIAADGYEPSTKQPSCECVISVNEYEAVDFATCSWKDVSDRCDKLESGISEEKFCEMFTFDGKSPTDISEFVGKERKVTVNNQEHIVRVIGTEHDIDSENKTLALTFEFANLICDSDGHSLAYQWCDDGNNTDYENSTIRYALTGNGFNGGTSEETKRSTIFVAQKGATSWSKDYNKTVYSMLPDDFKNVIKTVKKSVGETSSYTETPFEDKLFILSGVEMGNTESYDKGYGTTYSYYANSTKESRIKKQISSEVFTDFPYIPAKSGHKYEGPVFNYAGYNEDGGGYYWQRSPINDSTKSTEYKASAVDYKGEFGKGNTYGVAYGVAPAFCI